MRMKKAVALVLLLTFVTVFSCAIFAAVPNYIARVQTSRTVSGVTATVYAQQLGEVAESYFEPGGNYSTVVVYMQLYNNNTLPALCNSVRIKVNHEWQSYITGIDCLSSDLLVGENNGNTFNVTPSNDFSYTNGIVVPPKESLYLVFTYNIDGDFDSSNNTFTACKATSVEVSVFTVATSASYPYGQSIDLSPVLTVLNSIASDVASEESIVTTINTTVTSLYNQLVTLNTATSGIASEVSGLGNDIDSIISILTNIYNRLGYSGTITNPLSNAWTGQIKDYTYGDLVVQRFQYIRMGSYTTVDTLETYGQNGVYHQGYRCIPFTIWIRTTAYNYVTVGQTAINLPNYFPRATGVSYEITGVNSPLYCDAGINYTTSEDQIRIYLNFKEYKSANAGYIPIGIWYSFVTVNMYVPIDYSPTFPTVDTWVLPNEPTYTVYTNSVDTSSNQVATQSDQVHTQEQNYFSQNAQAISNTGLSNYRFGVSDGNGIGTVSNDFTSVFNALGGWNTIYIFSLTLGVALSILRHSPNAINRRIRNRQSE